MQVITKHMGLGLLPVLLGAVVIGVVAIFDIRPAVAHGIIVGLAVAIIQSFISIGLMKWALTKKVFYFVWGGGVLFRFLVFAITALVVYRFTSLSFAATLLTLVTATTVFLAFESAIFLKPS